MDTNGTTEAINPNHRTLLGTATMKLEAVVIPVSDVDRAKCFYSNLGWRLDDFVVGDSFRVVRFTPPGSPSSIHFGTAAPGDHRTIARTR